MNYAEYQYLWPPRPEQKIARPQLSYYENKGWWAQKKKNGTCTLVFARGAQVIFKTRHNDDHKLWSPKREHISFFAGPKAWNVYVAELLHSKVAGGPKDQLYIFDVLVSNGDYLVGSTFADRQVLLHDRFEGKDEGDQVRVSPYVTIAKCFDEGFAQMFDNLAPEDEGLVIKNPLAPLKPCYKPDSNAGWQVKCRIPHKNYSF
jgi:hypothetical protein